MRDLHSLNRFSAPWGVVDRVWFFRTYLGATPDVRQVALPHQQFIGKFLPQLGQLLIEGWLRCSSSAARLTLRVASKALRVGSRLRLA